MGKLPLDQYARELGFVSEEEMWRFQEELAVPDQLLAHVFGVSTSTIRDRPRHKSFRARKGTKARGHSKGFRPIMDAFTKKQVYRLVQFLCEEWKRNQRH